MECGEKPAVTLCPMHVSEVLMQLNIRVTITDLQSLPLKHTVILLKENVDEGGMYLNGVELLSASS